MGGWDECMRGRNNRWGLVGLSDLSSSKYIIDDQWAATGNESEHGDNE
jgi:hypothetical protein